MLESIVAVMKLMIIICAKKKKQLYNLFAPLLLRRYVHHCPHFVDVETKIQRG